MSKNSELVLVDVDLSDNFKYLQTVMPEHGKMLEVIKETTPEIHRASSLFFKTQSQFMDNMLTVSHNTPIRNLRQILAQMNKTKESIKEAAIKLKRKEIEIKIKERSLQEENDEFQQELLKVDIIELKLHMDTTLSYISGAIRLLANYSEQYNSILKKHNLDGFNEVDFEKEEERYHIMKAFEQAMCAARTNGGVIDNGNMIYLTQIGINGASAQKELTQYLRLEQKLLNEGKEPTYKMYLMFLDRMAQKYQGSAEVYAENKGMKPVSELALLQSGDTRLLEIKNSSNEKE